MRVISVEYINRELVKEKLKGYLVPEGNAKAINNKQQTMVVIGYDVKGYDSSKYYLIEEGDRIPCAAAFYLIPDAIFQAMQGDGWLLVGESVQSRKRGCCSWWSDGEEQKPLLAESSSVVPHTQKAKEEAAGIHPPVRYFPCLVL